MSLLNSSSVSLTSARARQSPQPLLSSVGVRWRRVLRHTSGRALSSIFMTSVLSALSLFLCTTHFLALSLSATAAKPFVWIGNVTEASFEVSIDISSLEESEKLPSPPSLVVSTSSKLAPVVQTSSPSPAFPAPHEAIHRYSSTSLSPGTTYHFGFPGIGTLGQITTFPSNPKADVVFALSSCQKWAQRSRSLASIADTLPQPSNTRAVLMLHAGDLHYQNIVKNDARLYRSAMTDVVTTDDASRVFSRMQVSYVPDDHDSGPNNAGRDSPSKEAMQINYRRMVPRTGNNISDSLLYHAFTVASVRFVLTDLRTESDKAEGRMMSDKQLDWFLRKELTDASSYSAVVWVSSRPWISEEDPAKDTWGAVSPGQRRIIANFIADNAITNLILVAGDAHMLAADDGRHSDYSSRGKPQAGFPVFQSAPLANFGSSKGGPYSEGCHAFRFVANYQFSIVRVFNVGSSRGPCVSYKGFVSGNSEPKIEFEKCGVLGGVEGVQGGGQGPKCKISLAPAWLWVVAVLFCCAVIAGFGVCGTICWKRRKSTRANTNPQY